jgi:hypothetical protein
MSFVSPERARANITGLSALEARSLTEIGRGCDSVAYLVNGEWVFRFPAVPDAQATLRRELALLPALRPTLPLATPAFEHIGRADGELRFVGYRIVPGAPLRLPPVLLHADVRPDHVMYDAAAQRLTG